MHKRFFFIYFEACEILLTMKLQSNFNMHLNVPICILLLRSTYAAYILPFSLYGRIAVESIAFNGSVVAM